MNSPEVIGRLRAVHSAGGSLVVILDYDGTLAPLAPHPQDATLPTATAAALHELVLTPRVTVAVVSGRSLADLRTKVPIENAWLAGSAGMEMDMDGELIRHPDHDTIARSLDQLAGECQRAVTQWPGAWIERKPAAFTVHFRDALEHADQVEAALRGVVGGEAEFVVLRGPAALEVSARSGWHKGNAVATILERVGAGEVLAFYAGDHENDAAAFREIARVAGITVAVGNDAPAGATLNLSSPEVLRELLLQLVRALAPTDQSL